MNNPSVPDRIIDAAIELVRTQGYKGATTRAIANKAGVNEVTLFRHFGSKKGIVEAAVNRFSFVEPLKRTLEHEVTWDLEADLRLIATQYHRIFEQNGDMMLIGIRESGIVPDLDKMIARIPLGMKGHLMDYMNEMHRRGKLIDTNIEAAVMNFIWLNFGFVLSKARLGSQVTSIGVEEFIDNSIRLFARALTP